MSPISSTTPRVPATSTSSPSRSGWVIAIRSPATKLPIVRWLAKPITRPITADEASTPPATARTCGITSSADMTPRKTIDGEDGAPQHAVARDHLGRESRREIRQSTTFASERGRDDHHGGDQRTCQKSDIEPYSPQSIGFRPA